MEKNVKLWFIDGIRAKANSEMFFEYWIERQTQQIRNTIELLNVSRYLFLYYFFFFYFHDMAKGPITDHDIKTIFDFIAHPAKLVRI